MASLKNPWSKMKELVFGPKFDPQNYPKFKHLQEVWCEMDADQTGKVTVRDYKTYMDKHNKKVSIASAKLAFDLVDVNHTGFITFRDLCAFNGLTLTKELDEDYSKMMEADPNVRFKPHYTDGHGHILHKAEEKGGEDSSNPLARLSSSKEVKKKAATMDQDKAETPKKHANRMQRLSLSDE